MSHVLSFLLCGTCSFTCVVNGCEGTRIGVQTVDSVTPAMLQSVNGPFKSVRGDNPMCSGACEYSSRRMSGHLKYQFHGHSAIENPVYLHVFQDVGRSMAQRMCAWCWSK